MKKFNLKTPELSNREILTRAEMRLVKGGNPVVCVVTCDVFPDPALTRSYPVTDCSFESQAGGCGDINLVIACRCA